MVKSAEIGRKASKSLQKSLKPHFRALIYGIDRIEPFPAHRNPLGVCCLCLGMVCGLTDLRARLVLT